MLDELVAVGPFGELVIDTRGTVGADVGGHIDAAWPVSDQLSIQGRAYPPGSPLKVSPKIWADWNDARPGLSDDRSATTAATRLDPMRLR
jgi:hypothetical protein